MVQWQPAPEPELAGNVLRFGVCLLLSVWQDHGICFLENNKNAGDLLGDSVLISHEVTHFPLGITRQIMGRVTRFLDAEMVVLSLR